MGSLCHFNGSIKLQQSNSTKLSKNKITISSKASRSLTTTRRIAPFITLFNLHIFANNDDQVIEKPIKSSQGKAIHAFEQTSCDAMLSSIESGMMDEAMIKMPRQTNRRNIGWLALITL
mmetsp:Transcript_5274/g.9458  ORF Transcript_5274/g.9458 Transcript_5274/m.9458 type:complete len:119 (-) Transcript_5274:116-472(-)